MHPQTLTSADALITIVSEATTTIDAQSPHPRPDWIIEFLPGGWHTHPRCLTTESDLPPERAVARFLDDIQADRSPLWIRYKGAHPTECGPVNLGFYTLDEYCDQETEHLESGERLIVRLWSGTILRTLDQTSP